MTQSPPKASFSDWLALMAGITGAFLAILDIQITNSSLAQLEGAMGASSDEGSWISTAYLIAEMVAIPLTGWLASALTLRNFLLGSTVLFLISSMACGLATSLNQLILFRVFQGLTGGVLIPTAVSIVRTRLPRDQQPLGITIFSLIATIAPALGPTIGGWLTENLSWRYIFFVNLGPGALALALQWIALDRGKMRLEEVLKGDWAGIILISIGFGSITFVLEEGRRLDWFGSHLITALTFISAISISAFVALELTLERPLIQLRLFAIPRIGASAVLMTVYAMTAFSSLYLIPVYFGQVQGYGALQIGKAIMWSGLPQIVLLPFVPFVMKRFDLRILLLFGGLLTATSCFLNAFLSHDSGADQLILPQVVRAMAQGFFMIPLTQAATAGLNPRDTADASAINSVMRNLGASVGIAFFSTFLSDQEVAHYTALSAHVTPNMPEVRDRLGMMAGAFDPDQGAGRAIAMLSRQMHREALIMANSDCFMVMGFAVLVGLLAILLLRKPNAVSAGSRA